MVRDDPRIDIDDATRAAWHGTVMDIAGMVSAHQERTDALRDVERAVGELDDAARGRHTAIIDDLREVLPLADELERRLRRLYGSLMGWPGPITADERSQIAYFQGWIARLAPRIDAILDAGPTP